MCGGGDGSIGLELILISNFLDRSQLYSKINKTIIVFKIVILELVILSTCKERFLQTCIINLYSLLFLCLLCHLINVNFFPVSHLGRSFVLDSAFHNIRDKRRDVSSSPLPK